MVVKGVRRGFKTVQEQVGDSLGGSKKDAEVRQVELLGEGSSSLAARLCTACTTSTADMLKDQYACDVIVETAQAGSSGTALLGQSYLQSLSVMVQQQADR